MLEPESFGDKKWGCCNSQKWCEEKTKLFILFDTISGALAIFNIFLFFFFPTPLFCLNKPLYAFFFNTPLLFYPHGSSMPLYVLPTFPSVDDGAEI